MLYFIVSNTKSAKGVDVVKIERESSTMECIKFHHTYIS